MTNKTCFIPRRIEILGLSQNDDFSKAWPTDNLISSFGIPREYLEGGEMSRLSEQATSMSRTITGCMTEEEWLLCDSPQRMWSYLTWPYFTDGRGSSQASDLLRSYQYRNGYTKEREQHFVEACNRICDCRISKSSRGYEWSRLEARQDATGCKCTSSVRVHLLREIFANPFRPVVREGLYLTDAAVHMRVKDCAMVGAKEDFQRAKDENRAQAVNISVFENHYLSMRIRERVKECIFKEVWITPDITSFSQRIYEKEDFEALPILWDMLLDVGCDNQQVMEHLKSRELHVKGCWVLELLRDNKCVCWGFNTRGKPQPAIACPRCKGKGYV